MVDDLRPGQREPVRFALESATQALAAIEGEAPGRSLSRADRILGRVLAELRYGEPEAILRGDLHAFMGGLQNQCAEVSRVVQDQYSFR